MKKSVFALLGILCFFAFAGEAQAQIVVDPSDPNLRLAWDQSDASNVQGFRLCIDAVTPCTDLTSITVNGVVHSIAFPALTPGTHDLRVQAYNPAGAATSTPLQVRVFVTPPAAPQNLRIITGTGGGEAEDDGGGA